VAADAATYLVYTVGYRLARHAEGRAWARHAEVALTVLAEADDGLRRVDLDNNLAIVLIMTGATDEAVALFQRTLAMREEALGGDHPLLAQSLNNLANFYASTAQYAEAKALFERALAIQEEALGPNHPIVATSLSNLGVVYFDTGALDEAIVAYERALEIREAALGADSPDTAGNLSNLGEARLALGEYDAAKRHLERALAISEQTLGADHPLLGYPLTGLAKVALAEGRPTDALALSARALALRVDSGLPRDLAASRFALARALWDAPPEDGGDRARALDEARKAEQEYGASGGRTKYLDAVEAWLAEHDPTRAP
jgi:tetratricopeptide (TPR) repeat protein